jgi:hypothetical protein
MKIDPPIYISSSNQDDEVITFGKSPKQELEDHSNGVARLGGKWRQPNYAKAYLRSARILVSDAKEKQDLDQLAMPIFYLQRHAFELLLKSFLNQLHEIAELRGIGRTLGQVKRLSESHELGKLSKDLKIITSILKIGKYSIDIDNLVQIINEYELTTTFSRYASSAKKGTDVVVSHLANETIIPIIDIQEKLESIFLKNCYQLDEIEESLEAIIYYEWSSLTNSLD